jgi:hypothetical protein
MATAMDVSNPAPTAAASGSILPLTPNPSFLRLFLSLDAALLEFVLGNLRRSDAGYGSSSFGGLQQLTASSQLGPWWVLLVRYNCSLHNSSKLFLFACAVLLSQFQRYSVGCSPVHVHLNYDLSTAKRFPVFESSFAASNFSFSHTRLV